MVGQGQFVEFGGDGCGADPVDLTPQRQVHVGLEWLTFQRMKLRLQESGRNA